MLTMLMPDQISDYWDDLSQSIAAALPPTIYRSANTMNNLLEALVSGRMQCWVSVKMEESGMAIYAVLVTTITHDDCTKAKSLLIYTIHGLRPLSEEIVEEGYNCLSKFAKSKGCHNIIAYTNSPHVLRMVRELEGHFSYTYVELPLSEVANENLQIGNA